MSFNYSRSERAAVDERLGLKLQLDPGHWDTKELILRMTDLKTGAWRLMVVVTIDEAVTQHTVKGAITSRLPVGVRLSTRAQGGLCDFLAKRAGQAQNAPSVPEAKEILEDALKVYFMRGDEMKKWVPTFRVEWTQK
jgi:hypothetical protein